MSQYLRPLTYVLELLHMRPPHTPSQPLLPQLLCQGCSCSLFAIPKTSPGSKDIAYSGDQTMVAAHAQSAMRKQTRDSIDVQDVVLLSTAGVRTSSSLSVRLLSTPSNCVRRSQGVSLACSTRIGSICRPRQRIRGKMGWSTTSK